MISESTQWYVTTVRARHDAAVAEMLNYQGLEPFTPTYQVTKRWSDRNKTVDVPLFPGYVFCRFTILERLSVLKTPGVTSIIGFGGVPTSVPEEEVERIRTMVRSRALIEPWAFLQTGTKIRIERGPLRGVEGLIVDLKKDCRLVVNITLLQRSVAVTIDRDVIEPIQN